MCDSNGKYLCLNKLCSKHDVTYFRNPNIKSSVDLFNETDPSQSPSMFLFHTGNNDLENKVASSVAENINKLLSITSKKFPISKILFSSLLPRDDNLNNTINAVNSSMKENTAKLTKAEVIDHENLHTAKEKILHDKKHLNRNSVPIFARSLTRAIYKGTLKSNHNRSSRGSSSLQYPSTE